MAEMATVKVTKSAAQTKSLAQKLAQGNRARIFALVGDLGSGKTTFVQAFLRAKGIRGRITSPTFLIIRNYPLKTKSLPRSSAGRRMLRGYQLKAKIAYHIDCYRLNNPQELLALGFKKILKNPQNIVLIEWADKIKKLLPQRSVRWFYFRQRPLVGEREIVIK